MPADFSTTDQRKDIALQLAKTRAIEAIESSTNLTELAYLLGVEIGIITQQEEKVPISELSN